MDKFKLSINLLPKGAWGNDLSKTLKKEDWDTIRNICYKKANYICEICGLKTDDLDAHEEWEFCLKTKTQTLKKIIALCKACHGVKHFRNSNRIGYGENAKRHFMKINNCSELEFASHLLKAEMIFEERNTVLRWEIIVDFKKLGVNDILISTKKIPLIKNPYQNIDFKKVLFCEKKKLFDIQENTDNLGAPCVILVSVDNYNGTIYVSSYCAKKIEWIYDDIILKTQFCIGGKFNAEFKVEGLDNNNLSFKLYGDGGTTISKYFLLENF